MVLVALGLGGVVAFAARRNDDLAAGEVRVTEIAGSASVVAAATGDTPLVVGMTLRQGTTLRTESASRAKLEFSDGTIVEMAADTEWGVEEFTHESAPGGEHPVSKTKLRFDRGELEIQVVPIDFQRGAKFQVETPAGTASIRGTTFRVTLRPLADGTGAFALSVSEGMVGFFSKDGKTVRYASPNRPFSVKVPNFAP